MIILAMSFGIDVVKTLGDILGSMLVVAGSCGCLVGLLSTVSNGTVAAQYNAAGGDFEYGTKLNFDVFLGVRSSL